MEKVKNNVNVIIGCIDDDKFYRLELEIKNFDTDMEVLFSDKFEICKNGDIVKVIQKDMIDLNIDNYAKPLFSSTFMSLSLKLLLSFEKSFTSTLFSSIHLTPWRRCALAYRKAALV